MARRRPVFRACECQDDAHFSRQQTPAGLTPHDYMEEKDDVVPGDGFKLALCWYCRCHHGAVKQPA